MRGMIDRERSANRRLLWVLLLGAILAGPLAWWLLPTRTAPDVAFTPLAQGPRHLTELRGRPVLVSFWATTCPPCVEELPDLRRLYEAMQPRGLELLAVAMPYDPPLYVEKFTHRHELPWPVILDVDGTVSRSFGVAHVPTAFLIGPGGEILFQQSGKLDTARVARIIETLLPPPAR